MKKNIIFSFLISFALFADDFDSAKKSYNSGQYLDAADFISSAIQADSTNAELHAFASEVFFNLDNLDESYSHIFKAIELDKKNEEYRNKSESLMDIKGMITDARRSSESGFYEEAIDSYNNINKKMPNFALPYYLKGMEYYHQSDFDLAVESIKIAIENNPFEDRYSAALTNIAIKLYNEGKESIDRKDWEEAILKFTESIQVKPDFVEARFKLAYSYYKLTDYDMVIETVNEIIVYDPKAYQTLKLLGDTYQKISDPQNAISSYQNAIEANENYDRAYYSLAKIYYNNGDTDKAIESLSQAVVVSPQYGKAYELLGTVYQDIENLDNAVKNYELAIKYSRKSYSIQYRIASSYNLKKDYTEARDHAKLAIEYKRNYAPAYFELGLAEKCLGNRAAALDAFNKASSDKDWRKASQHEIKFIDKTDCE